MKFAVLVDWLGFRMSEGGALVYGPWDHAADAHLFAEGLYRSTDGRIKTSVVYIKAAA